ncbi:MAG: BamA/TamA family outer membrane protein [Kofleriaceae bacterium]|nr:BamA/TamA family outer membrane protein [Kofleriaceae bacterium]
MRTRRLAWIVAAVLAACRARPAPVVPGATDIAVTQVNLEPRDGEQLVVAYKVLRNNLGLRPGNVLFPARKLNEFRLAEDRRLIVGFLHYRGYFDAEVDEPKVVYAANGTSVAVTWKIHEGAQYKVGSLDIVGAPPEHAAMLRAMVPFDAGSPVDLEVYRPLRRALAERLQDEGYGHARGYSRLFVDRKKKSVAWFYYLDPGPRTRIGRIEVAGNKQVPSPKILERAGLTPGRPYSTAEKRRAELALLDTGAFASAVITTDADIMTGPPEHPDTGGLLAPEQVDANGDLVPRKLGEELALRLTVVEAPSKQLRAEVGVEADPTRIDGYVGTRAVFRNALGAQHHLVFEGNVGYGWLVRDEQDPVDGVYGSARAQYHHPGWVTRNLDLRITARWRDVIYPAAVLREITVGPGVRSTLSQHSFVDIDLGYRVGITRNLPALDAMTRAAVELPESERSDGPELTASLIADHRDDRVEPMDGWFASVRTSFAPGGAFGDNRWLQLAGDVRGFFPLKAGWSLGARVAGAAVVLADDSGVPFGPRLFGGGAWGMRGFGRDRLSPTADGFEVGGRSLVESNVELRWLPFRQFYGLTAFVDTGAAGAALDPFVDGVSAALGLGARLRTWYLPLAIDVSYRAVDHGDLGPPGLSRLLVLFRLGEAF